MKFIKVKTRKFLPPKDEIWNTLDKLKLKDGDILVITSKILAIHQGRTLKIEPHISKRKLMQSEADSYIWSRHHFRRKFLLTIKQYTLIPSSGIDESNANGYYILWPAKVNRLLKDIHARLTRKFRIRNLGLIATDSHSIPMRRGTIGVGIGFYGFYPQSDYRGQPDIFGRKLKYTLTNIVDSFAAMAVHLMGEGNERVPIVIIRDPKVKFTRKDTYRRLIMPLENDLYYPLLKVFKKK